MSDKWIYRFWRKVRQALCWHRYTLAELPGELPVNYTCSKCGHSYKNFENESAQFRNLMGLWYYRCCVALQELEKYDPIKAAEICSEPWERQTQGEKG